MLDNDLSDLYLKGSLTQGSSNWKQKEKRSCDPLFLFIEVVLFFKDQD